MIIHALANVFAWLDEVRIRPDCYVLNFSLRELQDMIHGYFIGLGVNGIDENVPHVATHFMDWLSHRKGWYDARGWAWAIDHRKPVPEVAFNTFFKLIDEFRQLQPTILASVPLGPQNDPTGKRARIGYEGLIEKPDRIDIIRYCPEPLHFLRFHYGKKLEVWDLLRNGSGIRFDTKAADAKRWARDEFQVKFTQWQKA